MMLKSQQARATIQVRPILDVLSSPCRFSLCSFHRHSRPRWTHATRARGQAREVIVQGAVSIACRAVEMVEANGLKLTQDDKARIVSNLLTVTCSDSGEARPTLGL